MVYLPTSGGAESADLGAEGRDSVAMTTPADTNATAAWDFFYEHYEAAYIHYALTT